MANNQSDVATRKDLYGPSKLPTFSAAVEMGNTAQAAARTLPKGEALAQHVAAQRAAGQAAVIAAKSAPAEQAAVAGNIAATAVKPAEVPTTTTGSSPSPAQPSDEITNAKLITAMKQIYVNSTEVRAPYACVV